MSRPVLVAVASAALLLSPSPPKETPLSDAVAAQPLQHGQGLQAVEARQPFLAAASTALPACVSNSAGFGRVKPWVAQAGHELRCKFKVRSMIGVARRGGASDHPSGLALDFMVDRATGDALARFVQDNKDRLKVKYVIWRQRVDYGSGWKSMASRGGATANHMDHVHVSFNRR